MCQNGHVLLYGSLRSMSYMWDNNFDLIFMNYSSFLFLDLVSKQEYSIFLSVSMANFKIKMHLVGSIHKLCENAVMVGPKAAFTTKLHPTFFRCGIKLHLQKKQTRMFAFSLFILFSFLFFVFLFFLLAHKNFT